MIEDHSLEAARLDSDDILAGKPASEACLVGDFVFFNKHFAADLVSRGADSCLEVSGWKPSDLVHRSDENRRAVLSDFRDEGVRSDSLICLFDERGKTFRICDFHTE